MSETTAVIDLTSLLQRLDEARRRIGRMCAERRGPRMSIPAQKDDDDLFICDAIADAMKVIESKVPERMKDGDLPVLRDNLFGP